MLFKSVHPLEQRQQESKKMREQYPDRIPVIVEKGTKNMPDIEKKKYLVPTDLTIGQFVHIVRKRIKLSPEQAVFIFVDGSTLPPVSALISKVYDDHKDEDGFLYITYNGENTFGNPIPS